MKYLSKKRGLSGENLPETLLWFSASLATFRRVARGFAEIPQAPALQYEGNQDMIYGNHISCQIYDICYKYITKIYINIQNISNHYIWYDDVHILRANRNAYKQTCFKDLQRAFFLPQNGWQSGTNTWEHYQLQHAQATLLASTAWWIYDYPTFPI